MVAPGSYGPGAWCRGAWGVACAVRGLSFQVAPAQKTAEKTATQPGSGSPTFPKSAPAKVERQEIKLEVICNGVFESERMTEVSIRPRAWALPLVVDRAVELGTPVKRGEVIVEFDREKIDKAIEDAEVELTLGELALKQAEEELPVLEKALPVDLAAADRSKAQADEDLKKFLETDRPQGERSARFTVKRSAEYLDYSKEELRQLEKMYRSKDLTEETEEIILRRHRFQVEVGEFFLKEAELHRDQTLKVDLPRQEQKLRETAVKQAIDLEKARALLPLSVNQKRLALAKLKHDQSKSASKLADLRRDREAMIVHAPTDGLIYYGRCDRGHWSAAATAAKLHKGGVIAPDEVFITVVAQEPLQVRAAVDEKDFAALSLAGDPKGFVMPAFDPERRLPARLVSILPIPRDAGKFEAVASFNLDSAKPAIKPGMACTVKFVPYRNDHALVVPRAAVFEDDSTGSITKFVYLAKPGPDGKFPRRDIKTGKTIDGKTEILQGLTEHDEILMTKP